MNDHMAHSEEGSSYAQVIEDASTRTDPERAHKADLPAWIYRPDDCWACRAIQLAAEAIPAPLAAGSEE